MGMLLLLATGGLPRVRPCGGGGNVSIWLIDFYVNVKPFCASQAFGPLAQGYRIAPVRNRAGEPGYAQSWTLPDRRNWPTNGVSEAEAKNGNP
jgi:hypothetical protein